VDMERLAIQTVTAGMSSPRPSAADNSPIKPYQKPDNDRIEFGYITTLVDGPYGSRNAGE
jgi:hypothetical protein